MLKPLIFILIMVTLLAIGINLGLFDETIADTNSKSSLPIETTSIIENEKTIDTSTKRVQTENSKIPQESNLSNELNELLKAASIHFQKSEDAEAFNLYDEVIRKTENSNDPKILKFFAEALFRKATLDNIYPNNDPEAAIEDYERVINKFNNSDNVELLKLYIQARHKQARLQSLDELLSTYDELIKRFSSDKEKRFDKEVEALQFSQSFALMGNNAEAAMEVLDNIIEKYQARGEKKLPQSVEYSILNNIELSIITSNDDEKYIDLANKYLSKNKDTAPLLDMLNIIKSAQDLDQREAIDKWMSEYKDYHFPDWDFSELSEWAEKMESPESKKRIKEYLDIFLKQKYSRPNENQIVYETSNSQTDNDSYADPYAQIPETDEEEPYIYEPDPYINDIYGTDNVYPNPYATENQGYPNPYGDLPQDPNDGVSHTYTEEGNQY